METPFGARLRELREKRGLTQDELGRRFNLSKQAISSYEAGGVHPPPKMIARFAEFFGVTTDYLLGRSDDPHPATAAPEEEDPWPEGVQVLRRASSKLTPEKKRFLIRLIEATLAEEEEAARERGAGEEADHHKGKPRKEGGPRRPGGK